MRSPLPRFGWQQEAEYLLILKPNYFCDEERSQKHLLFELQHFRQLWGTSIIKAESYERRGVRRKTVLYNSGKRCIATLIWVATVKSKQVWLLAYSHKLAQQVYENQSNHSSSRRKRLLGRGFRASRLYYRRRHYRRGEALVSLGLFQVHPLG